MLWSLSVVLVANTNGRLAIPALAGLLVVLCDAFSNCLSGDLLPFVFDCLFQVL